MTDESAVEHDDALLDALFAAPNDASEEAANYDAESGLTLFSRWLAHASADRKPEPAVDPTPGAAPRPHSEVVPQSTAGQSQTELQARSNQPEAASNQQTADRNQIARLLLKVGPAAHPALGRWLGLRPAEIRRHLDELVADGLVVAFEQQVRGRPTTVFALTAFGRGLFQNNSDDVIEALLYVLAEHDRHIARTGSPGDESLDHEVIRPSHPSTPHPSDVQEQADSPSTPPPGRTRPTSPPRGHEAEWWEGRLLEALRGGRPLSGDEINEMIRRSAREAPTHHRPQQRSGKVPRTERASNPHRDPST